MPPCITQHGLATSDAGTLIFVGASTKRLNRANMLLHRSRLDAMSTLAEMVYKEKTFFTAGERTQLINNCIKLPSARGGAGLRESPPGKGPIETITALHDPEFVDGFFNSAGSTNTGATPLQRWKIWAGHVLHGGLHVSMLRRDTRASLTCPEAVPTDQYFVHELRANYGEQTAWFFAFNHHLVGSLHFPAAVGLVVCIVGPLLPGFWFGFLRMVFGAGMTIIWGTIFVSRWNARQQEYNFQWHPQAPQTFEEAEYIRDDFTGDLVSSPITGELEATYSKWKRVPAIALRYVTIALFLVTWIVLFANVMIWYVVIRARHESPAWDGLLVVKDAIHGILMAALGAALFKGVVAGLMGLENYRTEKERAKVETCTFFVVDYWNFFCGLFILGFMFIPLVESGIFADSLAREGSPLNTYFYNVMNHDSPLDIWPGDMTPAAAKAVSFANASAWENATFAARTHMQKNLFAEKIYNIMIGPVVVARIFITLLGSGLPFLLQTRRRNGIRNALVRSKKKIGRRASRVFARRMSKWGRSPPLPMSGADVGASKQPVTAADITDSNAAIAAKSVAGPSKARPHPPCAPGPPASPPPAAVVAAAREIQETADSPHGENKDKAVLAQGQEPERSLTVSAAIATDAADKKQAGGDAEGGEEEEDTDTFREQMLLIHYARKIQAQFRGRRARCIATTKSLALQRTDDILEEAGLLPWESFMMFNDLNIQFSMLVFFCGIAPWIPCLVLFFNCWETRVRCMHLIYASRVPVIRGAPGIGTWAKVLLFCSWLGVVINFAMLMFPVDALEVVYQCDKKGKRKERARS